MLAYFRREVTQTDAAKMLEMRKADFAELATGWAVELVEKALEGDAERVEAVRDGVEWRAYLRRFLESFPECDPRCSRRDSLPVSEGDDLVRWYPDAPVTTYAGDDAGRLPPSQPCLGNRYSDTWDNRVIRSPAMQLARRERQPEAEDDLSPTMEMDGPEFDFVEAA